MKLTVQERFLIASLLEGKKDEFALIKILRNLTNKIAISGEEAEKIQLVKLENNAYKFVNVSASFDIDKYEIALVTETLKEKDAAKQADLALLSLYEKFVEGKVEEVEPEALPVAPIAEIAPVIA